MTTEEIEKLYLDAAEDFRVLLASNGPDNYFAVGQAGDCLITAEALLYSNDAYGWMIRDRIAIGGPWLPIQAAVAVAAMTESWRERLERACGLNQREDGGWSWTSHEKLYQDLPEAIVAAVKALASEKRTKSASPIWGTGLADAMMKAQCNFDLLYGGRVRQIVREEINALADALLKAAENFKKNPLMHGGITPCTLKPDQGKDPQ